MRGSEVEQTTECRWHEVWREPCEAAETIHGVGSAFDMDAMDVYNPELDDLAASAAEARRFEFVKELLTAPSLGTS